MKKKKIKIKSKTGLHARPASNLVQIANQYDADIKIEKENDVINAKSIMGVLMLAATFGSDITLIANGKDEDEAIETANDSVFGLGAAVFTNNEERGEKIAKEKLNAGACFVNAFVRSDPRLPFGGIKESGYGRELSVFGIREFVNIKTVYIH